MKKTTLACLLLGFLPLSPSAHSCPVCNQETGQAVRAGLLDEDLGFNLLATVLPFGVFLGITAAIHFGLPRRRRIAPGPNPEPTTEIG
jgi:hypothetical protein